jgi:hypothetical protein
MTRRTWDSTGTAPALIPTVFNQPVSNEGQLSAMPCSTPLNMQMCRNSRSIRGIPCSGLGNIQFPTSNNSGAHARVAARCSPLIHL